MRNRDLTEKQRLFCNEYMIDLNASQARIRAGYSPIQAHSNAAKLMKRPQIKAEIKRLMDERKKNIGIAADEVLAQLIIIARANAADFAEIAVKEGADKAGNPIELRQVEIKPTAEMDQTKIAALAGIKQSTSGIEVKLYDKLKALELLMRHMGMLREKPDHNGKVEVTVELAEEVKEWGK